MTTLADLLTSRRKDAEAQVSLQVDALCTELGVRLVPDHEGALLRGAFVQRRPVPPAQYGQLARSWEQFDRAFAPAQPDEQVFALGQLALFLKRAGVAGDLGDHILFVVERQSAPDILVSLGDDAWDEWLASIDLSRTNGLKAAARLREHLQRDRPPRGPIPERDP